MVINMVKLSEKQRYRIYLQWRYDLLRSKISTGDISRDEANELEALKKKLNKLKKLA